MPNLWVSRLTGFCPAAFEDTLDAEVCLLIAMLVPMDKPVIVPRFTRLSLRQYQTLMEIEQ